MAQKVKPDKERKEKVQIKEDERNPLRVDKHSDPISNFITNFRRQFREARGLIDWNRLFGGKRVEQQKQTSEPESIMGATKTVIRSDYKNSEKSQIEPKNKKPALRMGNTIKMQHTRPKNNKPKLGL